MNDIATVRDFYREMGFTDEDAIRAVLPEGLSKDIGHFNVFSIGSLMQKAKDTKVMPYNRRAYYKISLIRGHNRAEYADKVIDIPKSALLFASPKVPYNYIPQDGEQAGYFCIFTHEFLASARSGFLLDELPIFRPGGYPVFQLNDAQVAELEAVFKKWPPNWNRITRTNTICCAPMCWS